MKADFERTIRVHLWIAGRVQGVWFRAAAQQEARRLGVAGWVRNLADGRVEAVGEGAAGKVGALVEWCRRGPKFARVDELRQQEEPPQGLTEFRVLPDAERA